MLPPFVKASLHYLTPCRTTAWDDVGSSCIGGAWGIQTACSVADGLTSSFEYALYMVLDFCTLLVGCVFDLFFEAIMVESRKKTE
uniref:Uncharacterized protein n=1 Tax=Arundo donax TaxID=35708 RepID=A0A0A9D6E3_ARUDO